MKDLIKRTIVGSGLLQAAGRLRGPSAAILMYHSVMEDPARTRPIWERSFFLRKPFGNRSNYSRGDSVPRALTKSSNS